MASVVRAHPLGSVVGTGLSLVLALGAIGLHAATPDEERAGFRFADPLLTAELVAAEPDVVSPVAMTWDADGRLYVAEMRDYPNAPTGGTIRRLVDADGDGRFETSGVFADGISFPNGVLPWNGGLLVTAAPEILFVKDTNGDGRADERRVVFTGFAKGNQQLRVNGLFWGVDGWVYGANGRSDGEITREGSTQKWSLRGRDFRFRPDTGEFETLAGRSQFGHARDDWGNRFLSWNTIPVRHEVFPDVFLSRNPATAAANILVDCLPPGDTGEVFPVAPAPPVFNNESGSHFNALSGLHVFRGDALGPAYVGNAFVGESLRGLVHRRVLVPDGVTVRAERGESGKEFLASTDPWCHPVNFATGPDGALYVADFYRQFVEHPDWVARDTRDQVNWAVGKEHGRIWRIRRKGDAARGMLNGDGLEGAGTRRWLSELESPNSWRRETAQRLLFERRDTNAAVAIRSAAVNASRAESRVLALHLAARISPASLPDLAVKALSDGDARVRSHAVRLAAANPRSLAAVVPLKQDRNPRVQLEVALAIGAMESETSREPLLESMALATTNPWIRLAAASGSKHVDAGWVAASLPKAAPGRPVPAPRGADPNRQKVLELYKGALTATGDRTRGAVVFGKLCLACHYLQGQGQRVGPDLSGIANRPIETLLTDLLDPSRQVAPDYTAYEVILATGESITGMIASEAATRITVRHPGSPDESVARSQIRELKPTGRSLMPEGLEQGLSVQDVADLLGFLRQPEAALLGR